MIHGMRAAEKRVPDHLLLFDIFLAAPIGTFILTLTFTFKHLPFDILLESLMSEVYHWLRTITSIS